MNKFDAANEIVRNKTLSQLVTEVTQALEPGEQEDVITLVHKLEDFLKDTHQAVSVLAMLMLICSAVLEVEKRHLESVH